MACLRPGQGVVSPALRTVLANRSALALLAATSFAAPVVARAQSPSPSTIAATGASMIIEFDRRVPMRDGIELSADIYRPRAEGRFPVVLLRTPYNKAGRGSLEQGRRFSSHGYVYIAMDVRGRGDSDGHFVPYRNDGRDGYDAIEWAAVQPWSSGKVGTIGKSYDAGAEWLAAVQQPPHLTAMASLATVGDPGTDIFITGPTGLPTPTMVSWYHFVAGRVLQGMAAIDWSALAWHLPLSTMADAAGRPSAFWKEQMNHPGGDPWWDAQRYQTMYANVRVPVLHVTGWYDDVQGVTLKNFKALTTQGPADVRSSQKLIVGPWDHALNRGRQLGEVDFGPTAVIDLDAYILRWFDYWLKGVANGIMSEPAARLFRMGENVWTDENEWPPRGTQLTRYALHSGGRANSLFGDGTLSIATSGTEPPDRYTYDPARPVPFITEPTYAQLGGPDDYRPVERRDDVLVYTSEPLTDELTVCGPVRLQLYAASSARDADFTGKLIDVWPNGFAQRLTDGVVRARYREEMARGSLIEPGRVYAYDIDMWNTCQTLRSGHRIRLEVASSAFPKYDRNLNTGEPPGTSTRMQTADQTIYHDRGHPSSILLPIGPRRPTSTSGRGTR
jgi:putative CocE/NonD family hydrolase